MAKKTLHNRQWRILKPDGSGLVSSGMFEIAPPVEGVDELWKPDSEGGWCKVLPPQVEEGTPPACPKCSALGKRTGTEGVWFCENMHTFIGTDSAHEELLKEKEEKLRRIRE